MAKRRVYKYPIPASSSKFTLLLPRGYQFLRVGWQSESLFMWALVDVEVVIDSVEFRLFGTGHDVPDGFEYVATWDQGPYVIHMFKEIK